MPERIGLLVGWEDTFPPAFIDRVNREPGIRAEIAKIGGTPERYTAPYRVLIDRISHEVPHSPVASQSGGAGRHLRHERPLLVDCGRQVLRLFVGVEDRCVGAAHCPTAAAVIGQEVDRQEPLASQSRVPARLGRDHELRRLFPLLILKPATGGGWKSVSRVNNMDELLRDYNQSGELVMTRQEYIDFEDYVRCICIGQDFILPIRYDPRRRCYLVEHDFLSADLGLKVVDGAWALCNALRVRHMNSVEFAIKDGVPLRDRFHQPGPRHGSALDHRTLLRDRGGSDGQVRGALRERGQGSQARWLPLR